MTINIFALFIALLTVFCFGPTICLAENQKEQSFKFECVSPRASDAEAKKVLAILNKMINALAKNDFDTFSKNLDDDAYLFDKGTKKLVIGKTNVLARLKQDLVDEKKTKTPIVSLIMQEPYALVNKDLAIITYSAVKNYGGKDPHSMESRCSNVFVKRDKKWFLVQHRSDWKKLDNKTEEKNTK